MAGDDDDVYDKKPQRYAEDNRAAFISWPTFVAYRST